MTLPTSPPVPGARFCVAPMLDWTDRHCRYFHRLISRQALLYSEMITTGALLHGDQARHLDFDTAEHPLALQLGGSEPQDLARCARLGEQWGYDEINLNCGCPSERVQRGAFGACLMAEPALVADCVKAMRDAVSVEVTVKHRIGLDKEEDYGFVRDFVGALAEAGCSRFIVHARNAWLKGLSPKENRTVPPLRYDVVRRLKRDFPQCRFILNGGLSSHGQIVEQLQPVADAPDGVMIGRMAYDSPWFLHEVDHRYFGGDEQAQPGRGEVIEAMQRYAIGQQARGVPLKSITRHMLGLFNGVPGAKAWRRVLSDPVALARNDVALLDEARSQLAYL